MARSLKVKSECIPYLKKAVKRNGFARQVDLAEALGIARSTVSHFLNGKPVDYLNFYEISGKLALDIQEIADWNDDENETNSQNDAQEDEGETIEADFSKYIERPPIEKICYDTVRQPGSLLRIKSPQGMGKKLLVDKIVSEIDKKQYKVVNLSFLQASKGILTNLDRLLKWFSLVISKKLSLASQFQENWEEGLGVYSCTSYFEDYVLSKLKNPLILVLENVDRLFSYQETADDFLSLFRRWHEDAKTNKTWQKLRLIITYSTEEYIPADINKSPLSVGTEIELPDFTLEQVLTLANKYNGSLSQEDVQKITDIIGGHPYLVQKAIYAITQQQLSLADFEQTAATEGGIYSDHLRGHLLNLQEHSALKEGMKKVVESSSPVDLDTTIKFQLHSLGLVEFEQNAIKARCKLYSDYFSNCLTK